MRPHLPFSSFSIYSSLRSCISLKLVVDAVLENREGVRDALARNGISFFADFFPRICLNTAFHSGILEEKVPPLCNHLISSAVPLS